MNPLKKYLLFVCLLFSYSGLHSQSLASQADSLQRLLQTNLSYDDKIEALSTLSDIYSYSDSVKAVDYALQIKKLAEAKNDHRGVGIAYYRLGGAYLEFYDLDKAEQSYLKAEEVLENDTTRIGLSILGRVWSNHGLIYQRRGNSNVQMQYMLDKTIPINQKLKDSVRLGINYYNLGIIFQNIKDYEKSVPYFKDAITLLVPHETVPELKDAYSKLTESMIYLDVPQEMEDSTDQLLDKAYQLIRKYPDVISEIVYWQAKGMCAEYFNENIDEADSYYKNAYEIATQYNLPPYRTALLLRRFYIKEKQHKYREALGMLETVYYQFGTYLTPNDKLLYLRHLIDTQDKLNNPAASLKLLREYRKLSDSIYTAGNSLKVQELEQKYAAKEKETQIIKLNQLNQEQQLQIQTNRQSLYMLITVLVFITAFFIARQIINRKKHQIAKQQAELLEQRIEKLNQEQRINHFGAVLEGQEQERNRLASDLHDGLGGALSGIRLKLSKLIQDANADKPALTSVAGDLDNSIADLRNIARNMMPTALLKYGLVVAIRDFCESTVSDKVKIDFQSYDVKEDKLSQQKQIMVFRIFQELITNAVKHAAATNILAQCLQEDNKLYITVEDDGSGFDSEERKEGMGLTTLKNRVIFLEGKLDIHSEKGIGTTTNIEFEI